MSTSIPESAETLTSVPEPISQAETASPSINAAPSNGKILGVSAAVLLAIGALLTGLNAKNKNDDLEALSAQLEQANAEITRLQSEQQSVAAIEGMMKDSTDRIVAIKNATLKLQLRMAGDKDVYEAMRLIIDHLGDFMMENHGSISAKEMTVKLNELSVAYSDFGSINRKEAMNEETILYSLKQHTDVNTALEQSLAALKSTPDDPQARKAVENALEKVILNSVLSFASIRQLSDTSSVSESFIERAVAQCLEYHKNTVRLLAGVAEAEQMKQILVHRFSGILEQRMAFLLSVSRKDAGDAKKE